MPSEEEGQRLSRELPNCQTRRFDDNGHFLLLVGRPLTHFLLFQLLSVKFSKCLSQKLVKN